MRLLACDADCQVVVEGEIGDAFYVILEGACSVHIGTAQVGSLVAGCSFGEKALENNALRYIWGMECIYCVCVFGVVELCNYLIYCSYIYIHI
mgnify:CR=1 FL=1